MLKIPAHYIMNIGTEVSQKGATERERLLSSQNLSSLLFCLTLYLLPLQSPESLFSKPAVDTEGSRASSMEATGLLHHGENVVRIAGNPMVWPGHILQLVHRAGFLGQGTENRKAYIYRAPTTALSVFH